MRVSLKKEEGEGFWHEKKRKKGEQFM